MFIEYNVSHVKRTIKVIKGFVFVSDHVSSSMRTTKSHIKKNSYLQRLPILTISVQNKFECIGLCDRHPTCVSINYKNRSPYGKCVLNSATENEKYSVMLVPGDITDDGSDATEWLYAELSYFNNS